jgi:hypothetical protein
MAEERGAPKWVDANPLGSSHVASALMILIDCAVPGLIPVTNVEV